MQELQEVQIWSPDNPMDRGAWWATVHGVAKSWTQLSARARMHTHTHTQLLGVDEETQSIVNTLLYPNVMNRIVWKESSFPLRSLVFPFHTNDKEFYFQNPQFSFKSVLNY